MMLNAPMNFMSAAGNQQKTVATLGWIAVIVCSIVVIIIAVLLLIALFHKREDGEATYSDRLSRSGAGLTWVYTGVGVSAVVLIGLFLVSMTTLGAVNRPGSEPAFKILITGHQWWWEARYDDGQAYHVFSTANELHIPVHRAVQLELRSADVIHSFWVPQLAGKRDVIPGQVNRLWMQADSAGVYEGQCVEYCGLQHAHMGIRVIAESDANFRIWWARQLAEASVPNDGATRAGFDVFRSRCGACHAVRGTDALGIVGPDLTHVMSRTSIAANMLPNTRGHLGGWIADAQGIKPGARMPAMNLSSDELQAVLAYIETLN